jgi:hypothetical protein
MPFKKHSRIQAFGLEDSKPNSELGTSDGSSVRSDVITEIATFEQHQYDRIAALAHNQQMLKRSGASMKKPAIPRVRASKSGCRPRDIGGLRVLVNPLFFAMWIVGGLGSNGSTIQ